MNGAGVEFEARMGRAVVSLTALVVIVSVGVMVFGLALVEKPLWARGLMVGTPFLVVAGTALFMVRGYGLEGDRLVVRRLGWRTEVPLTGLQTVQMNPQAMRGAIRYFGNGGMFCFCGWFWSRSLGRFRAYVTDLESMIVLGWADRRVVISPSRPEEFLAQLHRRGYAGAPVAAQRC